MTALAIWKDLSKDISSALSTNPSPGFIKLLRSANPEVIYSLRIMDPNIKNIFKAFQSRLHGNINKIGSF